MTNEYIVEFRFKVVQLQLRRDWLDSDLLLLTKKKQIVAIYVTVILCIRTVNSSRTARAEFKVTMRNWKPNNFGWIFSALWVKLANCFIRFYGKFRSCRWRHQSELLRYDQRFNSPALTLFDGFNRPDWSDCDAKLSPLESSCSARISRINRSARLQCSGAWGWVRFWTVGDSLADIKADSGAHRKSATSRMQSVSARTKLSFAKVSLCSRWNGKVFFAFVASSNTFAVLTSKSVSAGSSGA